MSDEESVVDDSDADNTDYIEDVHDIMGYDEVILNYVSNEEEAISNVLCHLRLLLFHQNRVKYSAINYNEFTIYLGPSRCISNIDNISTMYIFHQILTDDLINHDIPKKKKNCMLYRQKENLPLQQRRK